MCFMRSGGGMDELPAKETAEVGRPTSAVSLAGSSSIPPPLLIKHIQYQRYPH